jgi:bacterioferritin
MKPQDPKIIEYLNKVLKNELTVINQYFLHAKILEDRGLLKLAQKEKQESIEEMEHADWLMERVLFLDGLPNLQDLGKLLIGETVEEMLNCDLEQEMIAIPLLREAIAYAESVSDYISRELFEKILDSEEEHVDWLETQMSLINETGLQNYLQSQMEKDS